MGFREAADVLATMYAHGLDFFSAEHSIGHLGQLEEFRAFRCGGDVGVRRGS